MLLIEIYLMRKLGILGRLGKLGRPTRLNFGKLFSCTVFHNVGNVVPTKTDGCKHLEDESILEIFEYKRISNGYNTDV